MNVLDDKSTPSDVSYTRLILSNDTVRTIIDMISRSQGGIYLRYGDGDFNILSGQNDMLAICTPNFQNSIRKSMLIKSPSVLISIPHHCHEKGTLEPGMFPGNHENPSSVVQHFIDTLSELQNRTLPVLYTSVAVCYCSSHNPDIIIELHKEIKKRNVVYIGNKNYSNEFLTKLFGTRLERINTEPRDSCMECDRVLSEFESLYQQTYHSLDFFVIIMAAGCGGRALSADLYFKYPSLNFFILDYGSLLDCLWGDNTRAYMELDPPQTSYILNSI